MLKKSKSKGGKKKSVGVGGGVSKKNISDTIDEIKTKFGEDAIMTLSERPKLDIEVIPTGSIGLNAVLGVGGIPRGRIIEIYGPESSGKTTLALHTIAEAQKQGGVAAFVDAEHALDTKYSKKIGVNLEELLFTQPSTGEEALDITDSLVRSGGVDVIVVDSVAALTPKAEIEGDMDSMQIGLQARLMAKALRKLTAIVSRSKTVIIFINQIRMNIGSMGFGSPETTPGGKALKFFSSVRLDIRRIAQIKKGDEVMGGRVRVKVVKNKVAPPHRLAEFDLLYNEGITKEGELLALGEKYKIITKGKVGSYAYGKKKLGRGYDAARKCLSEDKKLADEIRKKVEDKLGMVE
ncbi:MAG: recombinase RecA [Candidatus Campbellbacteria bacterium]|nr:recombinase RecA [Candidatus Campbellbacteria bacterium]